MCDFFSFCMDEYGKKYYFNWTQRQEMKFEGSDSHDHIISHYNLKDAKINCFEYNPLLKTFKVDKINTVDNRVHAEAWARKLDFGKIVEPLIIKDIVNPLTGRAKKPTKQDIALLKQWASVWDSVGDSVRASVWASVRVSVRASVWVSVGAYTGSFFDIWDGKYKFQPAVALWERGFVASFDGKTWRLHSGEKAEIVYECKP